MRGDFLYFSSVISIKIFFFLSLQFLFLPFAESLSHIFNPLLYSYSFLRCCFPFCFFFYQENYFFRFVWLYVKYHFIYSVALRFRFATSFSFLIFSFPFCSFIFSSESVLFDFSTLCIDFLLLLYTKMNGCLVQFFKRSGKRRIFECQKKNDSARKRKTRKKTEKNILTVYFVCSCAHRIILCYTNTCTSHTLYSSKANANNFSL